MKIHSGHIEVAVANLLNYRVYTIVPNVSHGLYLNHECDMLALDQSDRFTEIEIKISMSDLKADFKKQHGHKSKYITRLVYAFPDSMLEKALPIIPVECGIITVSETNVSGFFIAEWYRTCRHRKSEKVPDKIIKKFMSLGCMRIWSLKEHNNRKLNRSSN